MLRYYAYSALLGSALLATAVVVPAEAQNRNSSKISKCDESVLPRTRQEDSCEDRARSALGEVGTTGLAAPAAGPGRGPGGGPGPGPGPGPGTEDVFGHNPGNDKPVGKAGEDPNGRDFGFNPGPGTQGMSDGNKSSRADSSSATAGNDKGNDKGGKGGGGGGGKK